MHSFKLHLTLLLLLILHVQRAQGALAQAILYTTDTSGTNARPSAVTISPSTSGTNVNAGSFNATNQITAGGYLSLSGATNRLTVAGGELLLDGSSVGGGGGDTIWTNEASNIIPIDAQYEFAFTTNNEVLIGSIPQLGMLYLAGGDDFAQVYGGLSGQPNFDLKVDADSGYLRFIAPGLGNVTSIAPFSGDGTTPYILGTSNVFTTGNLLEMKNAGTNRTLVSYAGGIGIGKRVEDVIGTPLEGQLIALVRSDDLIAGSAPLIQAYWSQAGADDSYAALNANSASAIVEVVGSFPFSIARMGISGNTSPYIEMEVSGVQTTEIRPNAAASTTSYRFGTALTHTSGNILEVENNGTDTFTVTSAGRTITPSAPPANASAPGVAGSYTWDANFFYICVATDTWKRVAIATW